MARTTRAPAFPTRRRATLLASLLWVCAVAASPARADDGAWVKQRASTPDFVFSVKYNDDAEDDDGSGTPVAIRVVSRRSGKVVQQISLSDAEPVHAPASRRLDVVDANFDGHPDIELLADEGGAGPNDTHDFYLFDPATGQFRRDDQLSSLTQVEIDPKKHVIVSAARNGCCDHLSETYRYIDGRLILVESWEEALRGDALVTTTGTLVGGKMHYREKKAPVPSDWK